MKKMRSSARNVKQNQNQRGIFLNEEIDLKTKDLLGLILKGYELINVAIISFLMMYVELLFYSELKFGISHFSHNSPFLN
jgi:hypothetical protein